MKIKYSNGIKEKIAWEIIQECILLTYSVVPYNGIHFFHFEIDDDELLIKHSIFQSKYEAEIIHTNASCENFEDVVIYRSQEYLYVLLLDEWNKINKME